MALSVVAVAAAALLLVPTYTSVWLGSGGWDISSLQGVLDIVAPWLFVLLLAPVVLALPPFPAPARTFVVVSIVCASALWLSVVVGLSSVGPYFVPGAVVAVVAACLPSRSEAGRRVRPPRGYR